MPTSWHHHQSATAALKTRRPNMYCRDARFCRQQDKTCGQRQSSYTPNSTAAGRNWRRRTYSPCRLDSQCSSNREEEEEEERFRDFRMRAGHKRQSWEHWTDSLVRRMNRTESISDRRMCFRHRMFTTIPSIVVGREERRATLRAGLRLAALMAPGAHDVTVGSFNDKRCP